MVAGDFSTDTEVLVIGGGPAGYTAAIRSAQLGKEVTLVEQDRLGGVCLNRGCIPQKSLLAATARAEQAGRLGEMGVEVSGVRVDYGRMQEWKGGVVEALAGGVAGLLKSNAVTVIKAEALFSGEGTARVITEYESGQYEFGSCVVATGARPVPPEGVTLGERVITSSEALALREIPESMALWGDGYVEVEIATIYARLGTEVTLLSSSTRLLPDFEPSAVEVLIRNLARMGVEVRLGLQERQVRVDGGRVRVLASQDGEPQEWFFENLVIDGSYEPNVEELALHTAGVEVDEEGFVRVDDRQRTSNPSVYAAGDVTGPPFLAHRGSYQAKVAAEVISGRPSGNDALAVPRAVFGEPELAGVGLTEVQAREQGHEVVVGRFPFAASGRALTLASAEGVVYLVAEKESGSVLGVHAVGPGACELVAEATFAVEMQATLEDMALTMHPHPTLSEMLTESAEAALGLAIHMPLRRSERTEVGR